MGGPILRKLCQAVYHFGLLPESCRWLGHAAVEKGICEPIPEVISAAVGPIAGMWTAVHWYSGLSLALATHIYKAVIDWNEYIFEKLLTQVVWAARLTCGHDFDIGVRVINISLSAGIPVDSHPSHTLACN